MLFPRLLALVLLTLAWAPSTHAQWVPAKPVRIIVPFVPGGPSDVTTRIVAQRMQARIGQSFVIENRPGAGGTIGTRMVAGAEPDGLTLLLGNTATLVINPLIQGKLEYDAKAFAPIGIVATSSNVLAIDPKIPANTIAEFIAWARARQGTLSYSSPGVGTPAHLIMELFKLRTGLDLAHVPYKGGGVSIQDVMTGQVQITFENPATALPIVQSGGVRALAVTSAERSHQLPDVPTMVESGLSDFVSDSFFGLVTRAGTPPEIVSLYNRALTEALLEPETQAAFAKLSLVIRAGTADDFAAYLAKEQQRWSAIAKAVGFGGRP